MMALEALDSTVTAGGSTEEECSTGHVSSLHVSRNRSSRRGGHLQLSILLGYVWRRQGQHHPLSLMTAGIATSMAVGPNWQLVVDSGSEHPPLISQDLADCMGITGVRAGRATQADSTCLQLLILAVLM